MGSTLNFSSVGSGGGGGGDGTGGAMRPASMFEYCHGVVVATVVMWVAAKICVLETLAYSI
jgi:hypothetical protein